VSAMNFCWPAESYKTFLPTSNSIFASATQLHLVRLHSTWVCLLFPPKLLRNFISLQRKEKRNFLFTSRMVEQASEKQNDFTKICILGSNILGYQLQIMNPIQRQFQTRMHKILTMRHLYRTVCSSFSFKLNLEYSV
jgi:hypothetical protein